MPASQLARYADSVCFSLCKGLACPIGSVLCGSHEFIRRARRYRKMLGGGMRQAGIIAAAGVYALENMVDRLAEDHENARVLAEGLSSIPGVVLAPPPQSNLVFFTAQGWDFGELVRRLSERGVLCLDEGGRIRMVTHYGIERDDVEHAAAERARAGGGGGLSGLRAVLLIATLSLAALTLAGCKSETTTLSGEAIVSDIPWPASEEAHYRLMDGDDEKGSGVLTIDSAGRARDLPPGVRERGLQGRSRGRGWTALRWSRSPFGG